MTSQQKSPRLLAFYLPQFYPFPENDRWWGKGFTEWTNVTKAKPLFYGHNQPHLPLDFGFYDLRVGATRHDQIAAAKKYGIDGFCYHYYWFSGKRLLDVPLDDMLADAESDMPFCLCWANENWTRKWDAAEHQVLIEQKYLPEDDVNFISSLVPYFEDSRYIRVDGKPFLIVYRPQQLPEPRRSISAWRQFCRERGIGEIHICGALTHGNSDYEQFGLDSGVEFPPHNLGCATSNHRLGFHEKFNGAIIDYAALASSYLSRSYPGKRVFKTVFPDWDNSPRTGNRALMVLGASPDAYETWLDKVIGAAKTAGGESLVFVNAWNEWAEGCHLEPDRKYGKAFLEATLRAKTGVTVPRDMADFAVDWSSYVQPREFWPELRNLVGYQYLKIRGEVVESLKKIVILRRFVRFVRGQGPIPEL